MLYKLFIISKIPVEFQHEEEWLPEPEVFRIEEEQVNQAVEAPEWVENTLTFEVLVREGAIRSYHTHEKDRNEPAETAEPIVVQSESEEIVETETSVEETPKRSRSKKKGDA